MSLLKRYLLSGCLLTIVLGVSAMSAQAQTYNSSCENFTAPTSVKAGERVEIRATFKNTGINAWTLADSREQQNNIKLGSLDKLIPPSNWYPGRIVKANTTVPSNGTVEFSFIARAPIIPGLYRRPGPGVGPVFGWQLLGENSNPIGWFGAACGADITVLPSSEGSINSIDTTSGEVVGFAYDPQATSESVDVHLYIDRESINSGGTFIGSINADQSSPVYNITISPPISGNHKFIFSIPLAYRDGVAHTLYARAIDKEGGGSFPIGAPTTFTLSGGSVGAPLPKPSSLQYFGYYYSANTDNFREESKDFTNISMVSDSAMLNANAAAGVKSVLHVSPNICPPNSTIPSCAAFPTEALALAEFQRQFDIQWNQIKAYVDPDGDKNTSDSKIVALYFQDEPILNSITNSQIASTAQYIKSKFIETGSDKLWPPLPIMLVESGPGLGFVTRPRVKGVGEFGPPEYCDQYIDAIRTEPDPADLLHRREQCAEPLKIPSSIDWIGYDAYGIVDPRKDTEWMATYERLKSNRSSSNQKIVMIPDAWWHYCNHGIDKAGRGILDKSIHKEISKNYYELSKSDPSVLGMIGWLWYSYPDNCPELFPLHKQPSPHSIGVRDMPKDVLDENIRIGQEITGKTGPVIDSFIVTNLAGDNRGGSLRDATSRGFRNVTFDLHLLPGNDGIIHLTNEIDINGPHITIDASAVPAPGITLDGAGIKIRGDRGDKSAHNITIKNIRVRNAIEDGIQVAAGAYNILLDRVSISDSKDGNLDITGAGTRDVTVQNSIIVAPTPDTDEDDKDDQKNMLLGNSATGIRLYNNIIGFSNQRNPEISFDTSEDLPGGDMLDIDTGTTVDMRNNIIWDWAGAKPKGQRGTRVESGARVNIINNLFGGTPALSTRGLFVCIGVEVSGNRDWGEAPNGGQAFVSGNRFLDTTQDLNARGNVSTEFAVPEPAFNAQTPCVGAGTTIVSAGTSPRDFADQAVIDTVRVGCPPFNELFITSAKWWQYQPNTDLTFQAKIYNHSNVPIQGGTARLKITGAGGPALPNQTITLPMILPGATKTVKLPPGHKITDPGSYTLNFCIIDVITDEEVPPDETKNCIKGKLNVGTTATGIDIIADKFIINASLKNGSAKIKTQIRAKNQGVSDALTMVPLQYKINSIEVPPAPLLPQLLAGKKSNVRATWRAEGISAGKRNYSLCADAPSAFVESDEANNCANGFIMLVETALDQLRSVATQFTQTLSKGARSIEVSNIQSFLSEELSFDEVPTGYFGPITESGVNAFQAENDLPVTGVWDAATRSLANEIQGFVSVPEEPIILLPPKPETPVVPPPPAKPTPPPPVIPKITLPPPASIIPPPPPVSGQPPPTLVVPSKKIAFTSASFNNPKLKIGGESHTFSIAFTNATQEALGGISYGVRFEQGGISTPTIIKPVTCGQGGGIVRPGSCKDAGRIGAIKPLESGAAEVVFELIDGTGFMHDKIRVPVTLSPGAGASRMEPIATFALLANAFGVWLEDMRGGLMFIRENF